MVPTFLLINKIEVTEIRASVLTIQVGFDTDRSGLVDDGFRFSGAGAPLPAVVASDLTADNDEDAAVITTAIVRYSLSLVSISFFLQFLLIVNRTPLNEVALLKF